MSSPSLTCIPDARSDEMLQRPPRQDAETDTEIGTESEDRDEQEVDDGGRGDGSSENRGHPLPSSSHHHHFHLHHPTTTTTPEPTLFTTAPVSSLSESTTTTTTTSSSSSTPCKHIRGWRKVVRNFTPSWFAVNMGTGIVAVLLYHLPWNGYWIRVISYAFFALDVLLFVAFLLLSLLRYVLYPEIWLAMIRHPAQSLFLGCFPMGFAIIINMMIFACSHWGSWLVYLAWAFWWADVFVAIAICVTLPFIVWNRHRPGLQNTTAALLLPIVPCVVVAGTGSIVATALPDRGHAFTTIIASYVLWGIGQALSGCVMALYFHRLTIHSLPRKDVIASVFLPLGPLGQGGFAIQWLGRIALDVFPDTGVFGVAGVDAARGAEFLYVLGVFFGLVMWGFGLLWLCYALVSLATTQRFPFNMGWWGFTFPLGVWATCAEQLWHNLNSQFFKVVTMVLSISVLIVWCIVAVGTIRLVISGDVFMAPSLDDYRMKPALAQESEKAHKAV